MWMCYQDRPKGMSYGDWAEGFFREKATEVGIPKDEIESFLKEYYVYPDIIEMNAEIMDANLEGIERDRILGGSEYEY